MRLSSAFSTEELTIHRCASANRVGFGSFGPNAKPLRGTAAGSIGRTDPLERAECVIEVVADDLLALLMKCIDRDSDQPCGVVATSVIALAPTQSRQDPLRVVVPMLGSL